MDVRASNLSQVSIQGFQVQFNVNYFGITPGGPLQLPILESGSNVTVQLPIATSGKTDSNPPATPFIIQMAIKSSLDIFYFQTPCMLSSLLTAEGQLSPQDHVSKWNSIPVSNEFQHSIPKLHTDYSNMQAVKTRLQANYIHSSYDHAGSLFVSCKLLNGMLVLAEIKLAA